MLILFDGVCNLCNASVNFIIDKDPKKTFQFASLQSQIGQEFLKKFEFPTEGFDTLILIKNNVCLTKSTAALHIAKELSFPYKLLYAFVILPQFIRDHIYSLVAKYRYVLFGKREVCRMPEPGIRDRFLS